MYYYYSIIDRPVKTFIDILVRLQDALLEFTQQQMRDEILSMIAAVSTLNEGINLTY